MIIKHFFKKTSTLLFLILISFFVSACGQMGKLYLPEQTVEGNKS